METTSELFDSWFDPIESMVRYRVRDLIEAMIEDELSEALSRSRYSRRTDEIGEAAPAEGCRHGHCTSSLMGTFGAADIAVPRARLESSNGKTVEWGKARACAPISVARLSLMR